LINNRQGSRRRGRGGSSQQRSSGGGSGQRDSGNRIDSRTRGNAAQLLEKYKNMARDAQMSGDRVQVEYYLQFADHYFRVLADSRARSDDHRPIRPVDDFDGSDEEYGDEGEPIRADEQSGGRQPQQTYQQNGREGGRDGNRDGGRDGQQSYQQHARDGQQPRRDDSRRDEPRRDDRQRRDYQPREEVRAEQAPREEQPAPQANGHDYRERVANDLDVSATPEIDAKPSVRRPSTRTRKPAPVAAEGMDADRLPPSLSLAPRAEEPAAEAAPEGEAKPKRRRRTTATPPEAQAS
jgi:hypothetical protein